jgi:hypothetical protein
MNNPQPWWLTWPPAEVAATILPLFSKTPDGPEQTTIRGIIAWCTTGSYQEPSARDFKGLEWFTDPDVCAVAEAIQVLEHAGLLRRAVFNRTSPYAIGQGGMSDLITVTHLGLTRLGWHTLHTNTVRQHLGLGDAPPTT